MSSSPTDRLQRPLRRPARVQRLTARVVVRRWSRAEPWPSPPPTSVARRGWPVDVHPLPPLLHNQPQQIAGEVRRLATALLASYDGVAVGYADCGTYGALDEVCAELGLRRLPGLHCYDLFAGESRLAAFLDEQPGTYLLTDFLVRSFERTVVRELGLDRYPELRDDYFRPLHAGGLARPGARRPELRGAGDRGGRPVRAATHRDPHRRRTARGGPRRVARDLLASSRCQRSTPAARAGRGARRRSRRSG